MIIAGLLSLIFAVLSVLLVFNLPALPDTVTSLLQQVIDYLIMGISVLESFIGHTAMGVLAVLLQLVIFMNAAYFLYSFVFWVLRKIPMLNVRE